MLPLCCSLTPPLPAFSVLQLLDELQDLTNSAVDLDVSLIDKKIDQACGADGGCFLGGCREHATLSCAWHYAHSSPAAPLAPGVLVTFSFLSCLPVLGR